MKKLNAKLSIPKVKSVYNYQQVKSIKRDNDTDPTNATQNTTTGIFGGGW